MAAPKDVHIKVFIDDAKADPPKFHFISDDLQVGPKNHLTFKNDGHAGFDIHFDLQEPTYGYRFPPQAAAKQAIWSKFGDGECPHLEASEVFTEPRISHDGQSLRVHNRNSEYDTGSFGYTLRVTNDGGSNYLPLDPGGLNQNGNYS